MTVTTDNPARNGHQMDTKPRSTAGLPLSYTRAGLRFCLSGCRDLNPGSLVPQTSALDQAGPHPVWCRG